MIFSSAPVSSGASPLRRGAWSVAFTLVLIAAAYFWEGWPTLIHPASREPNGYYALLTQAFLAGRTHLLIDPDPELAKLADPWAGYQGVPRLHDATYFRGRYYLYFGPAPALLLGVPWTWLTGTYLCDAAITGWFALAGALLAGLLLFFAWRRWFQSVGIPWLVLGLMVAAFGNYLLILVASTAFYAVPIACAYCCGMVALGGVIYALAGRSPRASMIGMTLASLAWGLAVASRPNYVVSLPALTIPLIFLLVTRRGETGPKRRVGGLLAATIAPAAMIGAALAAYNHARFGNIFEFGFSYQFTASDQRFVPLVAWTKLGPNLHYYFLPTPTYSPFFPFTLSMEGNWGVVLCAPFACLALAFPLTLRQSRWRRDAVWPALGCTALAAAGLNVASLAPLFFNGERYVVDFVPWASWLGTLVAFALLRSTRGPATRLRRLAARGLLAFLMASTLFHGLLIAWSRDRDPGRLDPLARLADRPAAALERLRGVRYGPLRLRVLFAKSTIGATDPLVVSGEGRDVLLVTRTGPDELQFGFRHAGEHGPTSEPIRFDPRQEQVLDIDLGCLYPPRQHPLFAGWPEAEIYHLRHNVIVSLDGRRVFDTGSLFDPTFPGDVVIGRNPRGWATSRTFSGTIVAISHRGMPSPKQIRPAGDENSVRLTLRFPAFQAFRREPLISAGRPGVGDLIFVTYLGPGQIRFGHDHWGAGAIESPTLSIDPKRPHVIEVEMSPPQPTDGTTPAAGLLLLLFDDQLIFAQQRPLGPANPGGISFGFNAVESSAAGALFAGEMLAADRIPPLARPALPRRYGTVRLQVKFPFDCPGRSEPLLVTGHTGAGDVIYVHYLDAHRLQFGYDHWSVGGPVGPPIPIDYTGFHRIDIQLGSLYPPAGDTAWGGIPPSEQRSLLATVQVQLDGRSVLTAGQSAFPASFDEIFVGTNSIGASSAVSAFTGNIPVKERIPLDPAATASIRPAGPD